MSAVAEMVTDERQMPTEIRMTKTNGCGPRPVPASACRRGCCFIWLSAFVVSFRRPRRRPSRRPTRDAVADAPSRRSRQIPVRPCQGCANHGPYDTTGVSIVDRPPHGGQISRDMIYYFEVVYQPRETHVYIYGPSEEPLPSQTVQGEVAMKPHYLDQTFRCSLKFVEPAPANTPTTWWRPPTSAAFPTAK